jgi:hypothetical protein
MLKNKEPINIELYETGSIFASNLYGGRAYWYRVATLQIRCLMFSYNRDEMASVAVERALGSAADQPPPAEKTLPVVCRHLGRVIIGWLTAIIVIEFVVNHWGGQL